jgi:hypothetical protein
LIRTRAALVAECCPKSAKQKVMKTIEFKQFIDGNNIEWHYVPSDDDVVIFVPFRNLKELTSMLSASQLADPVEVVLKEDCIAIMCSELLGFYGIELNEVFKIE